jgi:glycosyltransferase involved in cell wall biosynthesis
MMKISFLCYRGNPYCGGQGGYLYYLSRELARLGHEVTVLVGSPKPWPMPWARTIHIENLNLWGVRRHFLPPESPWRIFRPLNFYELAATRLGFFPEMLIFSLRALSLLRNGDHGQRIDLLHDVQTLGYGLMGMKGIGRGLVTTVHHPLTVDFRINMESKRTFREKYYSLVFYPLAMQRRVIRCCDRVLTSSRATMADLQKAFGVLPERLRLVYNGVDADFFRPLANERIPNRLLFVGNTNDEKKGIVDLLRALCRLPASFTLTIVDEGAPTKPLIPQMVHRMGLSGRVFFTGRLSLDQLRYHYNSCQAVVVPSLYEGFGLPAAEAMACGTPVVATAAGALPEVVGDEGAGFLVPPRSPSALAEAIAQVLSRETNREEMGRIGRDRVQRLFTWRKVAERTLRVYEELLHGDRMKERVD